MSDKGCICRWLIVAKRFLECVLLCAACSAATAQEYPSRPIRVVVTAVPGSSNDLVFRSVTNKISERRGWVIVIDNHPANHIIGMQNVVQSPADGYALLGMVSSATILPYINKDLPFDVQKDFAPLTRVGSIEAVMLVRADMPVRTLAELITYSKANPGKLNWSSGLIGGNLHIVGEQIKLHTGLNSIFIPYKTSGAVVTELLSGRLDMAIATVGNAAPQLKGGKIRAILIVQPKSSAVLPDVPSTADAGIPQVDSSSWYGLAMRAQTPRDILTRMHGEIVAAIQTNEVREYLIKLGVPPAAESPEEFRSRIARDISTWGRVIKEANIKPE